MTVADLYRVIILGQEVIIKDYNEDWHKVYKGEVEHIPTYLLNANIRWIGSSGLYVGTLELIIDN